MSGNRSLDTSESIRTQGGRRNTTELLSFYIDAAPALYSRKGGCFDDVFTKLSAWSLVEYEKVMLKPEQL